ncbi:MAG: hypothetical protein Q7W51_04930 [Coriobacteriia bacterium]|nr:hypothetical protein [Coriobacteriia bacterium]
MSGLFDETGEPDSLYERIRTSDLTHIEALRERLEGMWSMFAPHADRHFLVEFRKEINARYWEMYLTCAFLEKGWEVASGDHGPDILLLHEGQRVWIEAVEATQGADGSMDRCPDFPEGVAFDFPEEQIVLRYRNAIEQKHQRRLEFIESGIVGPTDVYIIAVNSGCIPFAFVSEDPPRIVGAVYPMGALQVHIGEDGQTLGVDNVYRPSVSKASGSQVKTDVFLDEGYSGISAVICSGANALNVPSEIGSDLVLVHNLTAASPVPSAWWPFGDEWSGRLVEDGLTISKLGETEA